MSDRVRILFHLDSLILGGLEKKVTRLALLLDRARFEPIVSYSRDWGPFGEELLRNGVPVERIVPCAAGSAAAHKAVRQVRDLAPRIFHSFSCRRNKEDVWTAREAGTPIIITARGNMRDWAPPGPARNWEFDRNAMTNYISCCCEAVAGLARSVEDIHPEKLAVLYNGVEIPEAFCGASIRDELGIPAAAFLAGYAAKYRPMKAHEDLIEAWQEVAAKRADACLICCGDDDKGRKQRLQELICRLGLGEKVMLLDARSDMRSFYEGLDLYVHAPRSEGFSNAILEAMSCGLPVIATAVGGTPEAIENGVSGILIPPEPRQVAAAILNLAERPEVRRALGDAARERVRQRFTLSQMVRGYESLYERAFQSRPLRESPALQAPTVTGSDTAPLLHDTTVFVTTIGDTPNFAECVAHLETQTVRCRIEVIDRVAPISAAFEQMHIRCATPYYVQVDEDMMLYPHALARLHELITQSEASVPLVCAPLWDCNVQRPLLGVKIYRHEIVKRFPYRDTLNCEVAQMRELADAGHHALVLPAEPPAADCLGEHGKHYTPQTIFQRWQRLFHKRNEDASLIWLDGWPSRLLARYIETRDTLHLYAALGAIAGIAGRADGNRELDWRDTNPALQRLKHYFPIGDVAPASAKRD